MTDRHDRNDTTDTGDGSGDGTDGSDRSGFGSRDYSAPKLYESSDFLAKYTSPTLPSDAERAVEEATEPDAPASDEYTISFDSASDTSGDSPDFVTTEHPFSSPARSDASRNDAYRADASTAGTGSADTSTADDDAARTDTDADTDAGPDAEAARRELLTRVDSAARRLEARGHAAAGAGATTLREAAQRTVKADAVESPAGAWKPDDGSVSAAVKEEAKKSGGNVLIYLALGLLIVSFLGAPGFVWPAAIILAIAGGIQLANRTGSKPRAIVALAVVGTTILVQIVGATGLFSGGSGSGGGGGIGSGGGAGALDASTNPTIEGTGNAELELVLPDGDAVPAVIEVTSYDETVRVSEIDAEREDSSRAYTGYREGTGLAPINTSGEVPTVALEIESEGDWAITLRSVSSLRSFDDTISGTGDDLVYYTGDGGDAVFTLSPMDSVSIDTYAGGENWWFSNSGVTSFTRPFESGPVLILIESYEAWEISMQPAGSGAPAATEDGADAAGGSPDEVTEDVPAEDVPAE